MDCSMSAMEAATSTLISIVPPITMIVVIDSRV